MSATLVTASLLLLSGDPVADLIAARPELAPRQADIQVALQSYVSRCGTERPQECRLVADEGREEVFFRPAAGFEAELGRRLAPWVPSQACDGRIASLQSSAVETSTEAGMLQGYGFQDFDSWPALQALMLKRVALATRQSQVPKRWHIADVVLARFHLTEEELSRYVMATYGVPIEVHPGAVQTANGAIGSAMEWETERGTMKRGTVRTIPIRIDCSGKKPVLAGKKTPPAESPVVTVAAPKPEPVQPPPPKTPVEKKAREKAPRIAREREPIRVDLLKPFRAVGEWIGQVCAPDPDRQMRRRARRSMRCWRG